MIVSASHRTDIPAFYARRAGLTFRRLGKGGQDMTPDFFAAGARFERIAMPDADLSYLAHLPLAQPAAQVLQALIAEIPWRCEEMAMWGRLVAAAAPHRVVRRSRTRAMPYSGVGLDPLPWTPLLVDIKARIEEAAAATFNSVLLNYYRDHRDSVGFHSDDEPELGERPAIASLSLGEERVFVLKHKRSKTVQPMHLRLASGSLLLMRGDTQRYWRHAILKESRPCGSRVNLTFRTIARSSAIG